MKSTVLPQPKLNEILITYIIPCYNSAKSILKLLESIDRNTERNYEIICVDDGSTDNTYSVLQSYSLTHENIRLFRQENKGVSAARNSGIKQAKGKYIVFADSDDEYRGSCLDLLNGELAEDLIVFSFEDRSYAESTVVGHLTDAVYSTQKYIEKIANIDSMLYFNSCWNKVYRANIVRAIGGFDEEISLGEDALFNYRYLSKCSRIRISKNCYYIYNNFSKDSLSRSPISIDKLWRCYFTISEGFTQLCEYYDCRMKADQIFSGYFFGTINAFLKKEHVDKVETGVVKEITNSSRFWARITIDGESNRFHKIIYQMSKRGLKSLIIVIILFRRAAYLLKTNNRGKTE